MESSDHPAVRTPPGGASGDRDRPLASLVLAFRLFALAVVAGAATFRDRVDLALLLAGVLGAVAVAVAEHQLTRSGRRRRAAWFVIPHAALWTVLVHATGGQRSPLAFAYLLELPLAGAWSGRAGVTRAALAVASLYLAYAATLGRPLQPAVAVTWLGFVALGAGISWHVVGLLERQRARIEAARVALAYRAESLAEELKLLGDCMGDALVSIDECGRIASLNPSGAALLGIDSETPLGKPWQEVLDPDPVSRQRVAETLDCGTPQHGVTMVLSPGSRRPLTVRAEMWLGAGRDGRRAHLLLDPGSDAPSDDPMRRLGESAACVAHQIKNSMHALEGFVQRLDREPHEHPQDSAQCLGALRHLERLAEDVLTMAGAPRPRRETVAIQEVLRSAAVLLGQAPIRMTLPQPPVFVEVHRSLLVHAVFNLLDNAVRMSPPGRPVEVSVGRRDDAVVVDIDDAGPGFPEGFTPGRGPLPSRNGAGLGLMAARRFVAECGGRLSLAGAASGGTRCHLELPAAAPAVAAEPAGGR